MFRGSWETGGRVEEGGKGQDNCMGVEALRNIILNFLSARLPPPLHSYPKVTRSCALSRIHVLQYIQHG